MRQSRRLAPIANSQLRLAIRQVFARPFLTSSLLLALTPAAQALTLGDISVRSMLGQPLDATVAVRLAAGEALASGCVVPSRQSSDLRSVPGAEVTTPEATREGSYDLQITSGSALYEPMYELELKVQCPGTPGIIRQYVLMLDLPAAVASHSATGLPPAVVPVPETTMQEAGDGSDNLPAQRLTAPPRSAASRPGETIESGARYRVGVGDTLSSIAARVRSRKVSLWTLAGAIQAANQGAFIRNDPNLIKLGSEILIPAATDQSLPAETATAAEAPVPVAASAATTPRTPPVLVTEPAQPAEPAQPVPRATVVTPTATVVTETTPAPAGTARPALPPAPLLRRVPVPKPTIAAVPEADDPNPVVAAGAGILFGLCISALLWARGRLPSRKRAAPKLAASTEAPSPSPSAIPTLATAIAAAPAPLVTRAGEPAFSVSYTPPHDDTLAADFAGEDVTSELEELFDSTDTTIQKRLNLEKTVAARSLGGELPGGSPRVLTEPGGAVDFLVGDPTDEDATSQSGTVDIHALAASATKDEKQAQTLLEALTLLERDYEEELTASQVLDMSAVREALGSDFNEPTQIQEPNLRAASARKRDR